MVLNFFKRKNLRRVEMPREHFNIIQPLIVTCRIFGLFPVYYQKKGHSYVLQWSLLYTLYSYALIITISYFALLTLVEDISLEKKSFRLKDGKSWKSQITTTIDIGTVILISLLCTGRIPFRIEVFWKLLSYFNKIDSVIPLPNSNKHRNTSIILISVVLVIFATLEIFDIIMWEYVNKNEGSQYSYIGAYIWFYILYYIMIVQEVFFFHLIHFIGIRIAAINEYLKAEKGQEDVLYADGIFRTQHFENYCKREKLLFRKKGFLGTSNSVEGIVTLTRLYQIIHTAVDTVNNSATTDILFILLSCLGHLILTTYYLLKEVMSNGVTTFFSLQMVWIVTHIFRVLIIVEPCHACLNKIQHMKMLVVDLLPIHNVEDDIKKTLVIFVMQLYTSKIKFSCCGLFKISRSIITSIAGTITTYIVILFQLNN